MLQGTRVVAETCILLSHENDWNLQCNHQPNKHFSQREHIQLFYTALHDRNIPVDFARATEDLSKYKLVIAPSLQLMAAGEADMLKLYVQNGGTLAGTGVVNGPVICEAGSSLALSPGTPTCPMSGSMISATPPGRSCSPGLMPTEPTVRVLHYRVRL